MKSVRFLAGGAVAALSLAGCNFLGGSSSSVPSSSPSSLGAVAPSSSGTGMGSMSTSMAPSSMAPSSMAPVSTMPTGTMTPVRHSHPPRHCTDLAVSAGMGQGTAGAVYVTLTFANKAMGTTCTVDGYPGVALTTGKSAMDQVGASAVRDSSKTPVKLTLKPGGTATALLKVADVGNFPAAQGHTESASYIQVYPPDNHAPQYVAAMYQGTTVTSVKYLTIGPVTG